MSGKISFNFLIFFLSMNLKSVADKKLDSKVNQLILDLNIKSDIC